MILIAPLCIRIAWPKNRPPRPLHRRDIGSRGSFPGPLFRGHFAGGNQLGPAHGVYGGKAGADSTGYDRLIKNVRAGDFERYYSLFQFASIAEHLAEEFGTRGQPISLTTACASGATSVQLGVEAIRRGDYRCGPVRWNRRRNL